MRAKLNMYIKDKYSTKQNSSSRRESEEAIALSSIKLHKPQESNLTEVALLDKLTPCMKTLQGTSHFSPSDNKTTVKKSHRTSLGRDYDSNAKVSFDFSNLEIPKQEVIQVEDSVVSPMMMLRKTSLQQDQPIFFSQHTSRSANQVVSSSSIQQLE